jgi:hypothetical protein
MDFYCSPSSPKVSVKTVNVSTKKVIAAGGVKLPPLGEAAQKSPAPEPSQEEPIIVRLDTHTHTHTHTHTGRWTIVSYAWSSGSAVRRQELMVVLLV